jgi:hypothetical protein
VELPETAIEKCPKQGVVKNLLKQLALKNFEANNVVS